MHYQSGETGWIPMLVFADLLDLNHCAVCYTLAMQTYALAA